MDRSLGIVAGCGTRDTLVDDNDTALSLHRIAADNVCSRGARALQRRHLTLLSIFAVAAFLPFMLPRDLTQALPAAIFVLFYGVLGLAAGASGITWILRTARLALRACRTVDFELSEEGRKQLVEFLQAHTSPRTG